jgi:hypothetical protein
MLGQVALRAAWDPHVVTEVGTATEGAGGLGPFVGRAVGAGAWLPGVDARRS